MKRHFLKIVKHIDNTVDHGSDILIEWLDDKPVAQAVAIMVTMCFVWPLTIILYLIGRFGK